MPKLFKVEVYENVPSRDGVGTYTSKGEPITVDSTPMVRLDHGVIVPAVGFHADEQAARAAAADRVELFARRLLHQAEQLRLPKEAADAVG